MRKRTIWMLLIAAIVGMAVALLARARTADAAPDDCLTEPSGAPPQGSHWYYRTDRSTNQRCWYLREKTKEAREAVPPRAQPSKPAPEPKAAPRAEPVVRTATPLPYLPLQSLPAAAAPIDAEPSSDQGADQQRSAPPEQAADQPDGRPSMEPVLRAAGPAADATAGAEATAADEATAAAEAAPDMPLAHMLALAAAALALAAIILRKIFKLFAVRRLRRRRSLLRSGWDAAGATPDAAAFDFAGMADVHDADLDPDAARSANVARMPAASRGPSHVMAEREMHIGDIEATLQRLVHDLRRAAA